MVDYLVFGGDVIVVMLWTRYRKNCICTVRPRAAQAKLVKGDSLTSLRMHRTYLSIST